MNKETQRRQAAILKEMRQQYTEQVATAQERLKEQNALRKPIRQAIKDEALTVPQIAAATGLDTRTVFWHITTMRKYDQVVQKDMDGEYFTYQLAKGKKR